MNKKNPVAVVYKLSCKNPEISDCYVGSTNNFGIRRSQHKNAAEVNAKRKKSILYDFIRQNGGWANWCMTVLEYVPCNSSSELVMRERNWFEKLNPSLNVNTPYKTPQNVPKEEYARTYYEINRDERREHNRVWYENKPKERVKCECGMEVRCSRLPVHLETPLHKKNLQRLHIKNAIEFYEDAEQTEARQKWLLRRNTVGEIPIPPSPTPEDRNCPEGCSCTI